MNGLMASGQVPATVRIVGAGVVGAVGGFLATTLALGSLEFGIFGAMGSAVAAMIAATASIERADRS